MARTLELKFPLAGVVRRKDFASAQQSRERYPCPWAVNIFPSDQLSSRLRGGSRPGLTVYTGTTPTFPTGALLDESGNNITDEAGNRLLVNTITTESLRTDLIDALNAYGFTSLTDSIGASAGSAPTGYTLGCAYRDRLVVGGGDHIVYMSRQNDWTNWDYAAEMDDAGRAVMLQASEATEVGATITALIPHRDSHLLIGTARSLWVLEGDPAAGGRLINISRNVGIISERAWCKVDDKIIFLSDDGLYGVSASGAGLEDLSGDKLPVELSDVDTSTVTVHLGYSQAENGVLIFLNGDDYHWFYDLEFGGFWPFTIPAAMTPTRVFTYGGGLLLWNGTSTHWSVGGTTDAGTAIGSHLLIGPLRPGSAGEKGLLSAIHGTVDIASSGSVVWRVVEGDTAEDACENAKAAVEAYMAGNTATANAYSSFSGTWTTGRNYVSHPRVSGMFVVIWLQSTSQWAFESIVVDFDLMGRWRK
jgi:hypothetical protein